MEIADLHEFPRGHPPTPYGGVFLRPLNIDEMTYLAGVLPDNLTLYAVGWLGSDAPAKGAVPSEFIDRLFAAYESRKAIDDGTLGWHNCQLCRIPERFPVLHWRDREIRNSGC